MKVLVKNGDREASVVLDKDVTSATIEIILKALAQAVKEQTMKDRIKKLEEKIQKEIYRLQMLDYPSPNSRDNLSKMQEQLNDLKTT